MYAMLDEREPFVASEAEAEIARAAAEKLQSIAAAKQDIGIVVRERPNLVVPLPARVVALILELLNAVKDRTPVSVIPYEAELTTQQAADYLNVSRPFLIKLLDANKLPHRMVGRHRRVRLHDLLEFERKSREDRRAAIADMAAEAERLKLE